MDYKNNQPFIAMQNIVKDFSGVRALDGISFDVYSGEIHCLVGENGAGKSTLMKVLSGAYTLTSGKIIIDGTEYESLTPSTSKALGINIIYQENDLVPGMNVVENIYVGNEITKAGGLVDFSAMRENTRRQMDELDIRLDMDCRIENLPVSDQQFVKILKALTVQPKILVLDEPTSMFNIEDAHKVLDLVRRISKRDIGIIYISHFLSEVVQIADRITVIRDGVSVSTRNNENRDISIDNITNDMVGRSVEMFFQKEKVPVGEIMLSVKDLKLKKDSPAVSFEVKKGEILGFSGMVGSGRTEIMRAIAGADCHESGEIRIEGKLVDIQTPGQGIKNGIAFITEDRQQLGLMLGASVTENTTIVGLGNQIKGIVINPRKHGKLIEGLIEKLRVKTPSLSMEVMSLSGGNQQKVVLAKWLFAKQDIYIFDEPTRGIDINAKAEFYKQMSALTAQGKCILLVSSDMPELISMSDRVLVVRGGKITDVLTGEEINEQEIVKRALGVNKS